MLVMIHTRTPKTFTRRIHEYVLNTCIHQNAYMHTERMKTDIIHARTEYTDIHRQHAYRAQTCNDRLCSGQRSVRAHADILTN